MTDQENILLKLCAEYGINYKLEQAHFLAQLSVESGGFTAFTENLNYSSEALCKLFPNRFNSVSANLYGRTNNHPADQEKIANILYGGRMGNGIDEGYKYRGRGVIQLTGKNNYVLFQNWLQKKQLNYDIIKSPDLVATDSLKYIVGIFFWISNDIGKFAANDNCKIVTRIINGKNIGLSKRQSLTNYYKQIL